MSDDPQTVSYPLTEVLSRIEGKVDKIDGKLDQKADRAEVAAVAARVTVLEVERAERAKAREVNAEHRAKSADSRRTTIALAIAACGVIAAAGDAIAQVVTGGH